MHATSFKTKYLAMCGLFAALTAICSWISIPLGFTPVPVNLATLAVFLAGGLLGGKYGALSITVYAFAGAVGVPVFAGFRGGPGVLAGPTGGFVIGYIAAAFVTGFIIGSYHKRISARTDNSVLKINAQQPKHIQVVTPPDNSMSSAFGQLTEESCHIEDDMFAAQAEDCCDSLAGSNAHPTRNKGSHPTRYFIWVIAYVLSMIAGLIACYALGALWFIISTGTGLGSALVLCVIPFLPGDALKIAAGTLLIRKLRRFI